MTLIRLLKPFRPRSVRNESAEETLARVQKRLQQIQHELDNWITMPTTYGITRTHKLEDEKQLFLRVKALLNEEIEGRNDTYS